MNREGAFERVRWALGIGLSVFLIVVWFYDRQATNHGSWSLYDIFPVFGLLAFTLMWTQFALGALRRLLKIEAKRSQYMTVTATIVLGLLLSHVGLLWFALWRDGFGLPPQSYLTVYSYKLLAVLAGSFGLAAFLVYELKRWVYKNAAWWKYIEWLQIVALVAIFYHSMELGREVRLEWFRVLWWVLIVTLVGSAVYNYAYDYRNKLKGEERGVKE